MELEACRDGYNWLIRYYLCAIRNYPEEYYPPLPLPVLPDYIKNLKKISELARKGILPHPPKIVLETNHPLLVQ